MKLKGKGWNHPGHRASHYGKEDVNDHDQRTYSSIGNFGTWPKKTLQDEIRELFSRFTDEWPDLAPMNQNGFVPHIDVRDEKDHYKIIAEIPGMEGDDIQLLLEKNVLSIEGEKKCDYQNQDDNYQKSEISYGHFIREIPFDAKVDEDNVEASYRNGVLKVKVLKRSGFSEHKKIIIQTDKNQQ